MKAPSEPQLRAVHRWLVTPAARLLRLVGVDPMGRRKVPGAKTYWKTRSGRIDMTSKS